MVKVKLYSGGSVKSTEVDESLFGDRVLGRTLKDAVVMYEANARAGTAKTKTRGEVKGPNKKLWRQKHTGRARMGTKKSPLWRGGGTVFGPRPRDYSYHMPKKARQVALRNAVFTKFRDGEVAVVDGMPGDKPSTAQATSILRSLGMERSVLVVLEFPDRNVHLSLRNVPGVDVIPVSDLNTRAVLLRRHMVLTTGALEVLKRSMGKQSTGEPAVAKGAS
jgi:large subunit ribosomal protein L4